MSTLRFAESPQVASAAGQGIGSTWSLAALDLQQLKSTIAQHAAQDPASAAGMVRDLLTSMSAAESAEIGTAIAAGLDAQTLCALAGSAAGRDLLDTIVRHGA